MFDTVLIANRGAIATRIIRTLKAMNIRAIAIYHQADKNSLHVQRADEAIYLGDGPASDTYLNIDKIIAAAKQSGAKAIHPGYGFLSENADFVARCDAEGIAFIGPTRDQIILFGLKHQARDAAEKAGVPMIPGSPLLTDLDDAVAWAIDVGYPIMLKSTAGGGGIGMQVCHDQKSLIDAWDSVKRLGTNYFSNDGVFLEKYIQRARHIEVQIFGDGKGHCVSLGERDCSAQRRNQKVIEESPAPHLTDELRHSLWETAERLTAMVNYRNAGTVEFIYDVDANAFYFLEVNTRLQVEHGVTEEVWGVDLVNWMVELAAGTLAPISQLRQVLKPNGHAVQVRIYSENPQNNFLPSAGLLSLVEFQNPENVGQKAANNCRIDTWVETGIEVSPLFDPMIAKIIATGQTRSEALDNLDTCLANTTLYGIETNLPYVKAIAQSEDCQQGHLLTKTLSTFEFKTTSATVLQAGTQTTLQDYPGRSGYWHVGVPPSGAMDNVALRLANQLLKNPSDCAALEITLNGPSVQFHCDTQLVITGAQCQATLSTPNSKEPATTLNNFTVYFIAAGQIVNVGKITGAGARSYMAVLGGFNCPEYLGSKSTFTLGQFGGHNGRALCTGDVLHLHKKAVSDFSANTPAMNYPTPWDDKWNIRVIYGPHGAPDFFTPSDIQTFFDHTWEVHYNSSRTGVRLIGPKPQWGRDTGGEAGLHPSNIHDNAYAFGSIDFTGDMPVILGPDGPSLGGFVCPATVITADLWKLGQLKAGAKIRFVPISLAKANALEKEQSLQIAQCNSELLAACSKAHPVLVKDLASPILKTGKYQGENLIFRAAGDHFLLVELGPLELDIERRFKVHALMLWLQDNLLAGVAELTPGIRSLQIHYDAQQLDLDTLISHIEAGALTLEKNVQTSIPSRTIYLPLSWDDEACQLAIQKYIQSVRPNAPWCPSNLEFIRRVNALPDIQAVKDIVFNAAYLVMGLGDVYLGAPVATPVDPRHRLVTTKYNPARTWTAENSVGIGGAYMCVYGMEGPGGYQFVGRTLQMWNRYRQTQAFDKPWLLEFFDQIRFYEVSHDELTKIREDFPLGNYPIRIEQGEFNIQAYRDFIHQNSEEINTFQQARSQAFEDELQHWRDTGQLTYEAEESVTSETTDQMPEDCQSIDSPASGNVWQVKVNAGDTVEAGQVLAILESMKMEIEITAPVAGKVHSVLKSAGQSIGSGQAIIWLQ